MSALNRLPERTALRAALMIRSGLGWRVGIGPIATGEIDGEAEGFNLERHAERATLALADRHDLIAVRG